MAGLPTQDEFEKKHPVINREDTDVVDRKEKEMKE
jgi:hypothetical protein